MNRLTRTTKTLQEGHDLILKYSFGINVFHVVSLLLSLSPYVNSYICMKLHLSN